MSATAYLDAAVRAAEADDQGLIARLEQAISDGFEPIATTVSGIVFYAPSIGGVSFPLMVLWLVVAATVFSIYFGFPQFRNLKTSLDLVRGKFSRASDPGEVTHFQALSSAVSGTVGLGNIAGVAVAVTVGGPGAMFWMVVAGLLGMCTKFVECTLGVKYREVHEDGTVTGGPFRYMPVAFERFGPVFTKIAVGFFAIALILFGALGGNAFQANQTYAQAVEATGGVESSVLASDAMSVVFGLVLAGLVGVVIIGGVKSIGRVTGKLVPFMAILYVVACLIVIGANATEVPAALTRIVSDAFAPEAAVGGALAALIVGFQRAAFSNEAGVGSAPIVHSAVKTKHPVSEGFVALLEPFIDTVVICSMTALTIVIAADQTGYNENIGNSDLTNDDGVVLTSRSFDTFLPWFDVVLSVAVALFAFSTLITWAYYTEKAWVTLVGRSRLKENVFRGIFLVFTVMGTVVSLGSVIDFADSMLFLCAIVNLLACYLLLPVVKREVKAFMDGRRNGEITEVPYDERSTT